MCVVSHVAKIERHNSSKIHLANLKIHNLKIIHKQY